MRRAPRDLYLDLLREALLGRLAREPHSAQPDADGNVSFVPLRDPADRREGRDWPVEGETMAGALRLDNVRACVERVVADGVPGDLIETGVWRGGTTVFMRAILAAHGVEDRTVWVADSFAGVPEAEDPADPAGHLHRYDYLAVPEDEVRATFARYGLLDDRVRFLPGWFRDTLPALGDERFAVVRLDGDLYESTMVALEHLYPRLAPGGYVIVDDYGALDSCRRAVDEYRARHAIVQPIEQIDWTGVFWRKPEC